MRSFRGWFGESYRHSLAARGIALARKAGYHSRYSSGAEAIRQARGMRSTVSYPTPALKFLDTSLIGSMSPTQLAEREFADLELKRQEDSLRYAEIDEKMHKYDENGVRVKLSLDEIRNKIRIGDISKEEYDFYIIYRPEDWSMSSDVMGGLTPYYPADISAPLPSEDSIKFMPPVPGPDIIGPSLDDMRANIEFGGPSTYGIYGTAEAPYVPYSWGKPESISGEVSLGRFEVLKQQIFDNEFKRLREEYSRYLNSNSLSNKARDRFLGNLRSQAMEYAESKLVDELGFMRLPLASPIDDKGPFKFNIPEGVKSDLYYSQIKPISEYASEYPEMKKMAYERAQEGKDDGLVKYRGGHLEFSKRKTDSDSIEYIDPFTGKYKQAYYEPTTFIPGVHKERIMSKTQLSANKEVDTKYEIWGRYVGSLRRRGFDVPSNVSNVNQLVKWYASSSNLPTSVIEEGFKNSAFKYYKSAKNPDPKVKISVDTRKFNPKSSIMANIRDAYTPRGAVFNSRSAANKFMEYMKGLNKSYNLVREDDKFVVYGQDVL